MMARLPKILLMMAVLSGWAVATNAHAVETEAFWQLQTSAYTRHFAVSRKYNENQDLIGLEYNQASGLLYGAATFRNSFSQRSFYAYVGKRFDSAHNPVYLKISGGLLNGYKGKYRDKIPLNRFGTAPVIIPTLGTHLGPFIAEVGLLGLSAAIINVGMRF